MFLLRLLWLTEIQLRFACKSIKKRESWMYVLL
jgi:hypothetical protein